MTMCGVGCFNPKRRVSCMATGRTREEAAEAWNLLVEALPDSEIAPCPFCGREPDAYDWTNKQHQQRFVIECLACNCRPMLIGSTREESIETWNKRS